MIKAAVVAKEIDALIDAFDKIPVSIDPTSDEINTHIAFSQKY